MGDQYDHLETSIAFPSKGLNTLVKSYDKTARTGLVEGADGFNVLYRNRLALFNIAHATVAVADLAGSGYSLIAGIATPA
jgi:hypothetical protein